MKFIYGRQDFRTLERAQENTFLCTNGLGGYSAGTLAWSVTRADQGVLVSASAAPNVRHTLAHRLSELLWVGDHEDFLSTQAYADGRRPQEGYRYLERYEQEYDAAWHYRMGGVRVVRHVAMAHGENAVSIAYEIHNESEYICTLSVAPGVLMRPKGEARTEKARMSLSGNVVRMDGQKLYIKTNGDLSRIPTCWEHLSYPDDAKDGRPESGLCGFCCEILFHVRPGKKGLLEIVLSDRKTDLTVKEIHRAAKMRYEAILSRCRVEDPVARQLAFAASQFLSEKASTGGKTLIAGYPLFGDWGRDTMIALPGCLLSTGRQLEAREVLETFLRCERDGLVPNLFPEGGKAPMYNSADAPLLLINAVYQYMEATGDERFLQSAWPVMARIVRKYMEGTAHAIRMDEDGLILAGEGLDQVTWMDVRIGDVLPTPRHGKPVELSALWYNALRIMETYAPKMGADAQPYAELADRVQESFLDAFYMEEKGYLRDVISGTAADEQIRPNQVWALALPFTMLTMRQGERVLRCVAEHLYTPCGLRTLSPSDPQYRGHYGGPQAQRDMAYHQGAAWVFLLGMYMQAVMRVDPIRPGLLARLRGEMQAVEAMLREGCVGQLPEIYDGDAPGAGKGCCAQAWSVGEMLRAMEMLEENERKMGALRQYARDMGIPEYIEDSDEEIERPPIWDI